MTPGSGGSAASGPANTDSVAKILCRICGDSAVRHVHYGGHCCFSCKAFFRRVTEGRVNIGVRLGINRENDPRIRRPSKKIYLKLDCHMDANFCNNFSNLNELTIITVRGWCGYRNSSPDSSHMFQTVLQNSIYRRAVNWQNKNNRTFQCKFENKCEITIRNRKTCQSCRFQVRRNKNKYRELFCRTSLPSYIKDQLSFALSNLIKNLF